MPGTAATATPTPPARVPGERARVTLRPRALLGGREQGERRLVLTGFDRRTRVGKPIRERLPVLPR